MAVFKVDITGINTNDIKVLSNKETKELFYRLQNGDLNAKEETNEILKDLVSSLKSQIVSSK